MNSKEKQAFINAYAHAMAYVPRDKVEVFLDKYLSNENLSYDMDEVSIVDALIIWNMACQFELERQRGLVCASMSK